MFFSLNASSIALKTPPCLHESLKIYQESYFFDKFIKVSISNGFTNLKSKIAISSLCNFSTSIAFATPLPYPIKSLLELPFLSNSDFPNSNFEALKSSLEMHLLDI